jgi:exopolyphosphatase/guanosine-5'-triphosphate,3'-diphosphate pyrophosphatase
MRAAVIDMGTNSTRLLIADVAGGEIVELERLMTITRLGAHVDRDQRLAETSMGRTRKVVTDYVERARAMNADVIFASATSAVRDSNNGEAFMASLARDLGIAARVLSGDEEARATFRGVTSAVARPRSWSGKATRCSAPSRCRQAASAPPSVG